MFDVFITYSRKDSAFAARLERTLERYRAPGGLPVERRRLTVFRDVQDLVGNELSDAIERALRESRQLVVVCSPSARQSEWVAKEIGTFVAHHGAAGVVPVLADGRPNLEVKPNDARQDQAFPDALLAAIEEPLAADFRAVPGEGPLARRERNREARFQLLATLFGTEKEELLRRHLKRTRQRQGLALVASLVLTAIFAALAVSAFRSEKEARRQQAIAVARQLAAEGLAADDGTASGLHLGALLAVESLRRHPTPAGVEVAEYASRRLLRPCFRVSVSAITAIALSPDGAWLAAADSGPAGARVRVWALAVSSPEPVRTLKRPQVPRDVAVSDGGDRVATIEVDGGMQVRVFDSSSDSEVVSFAAGANPVSLGRDGHVLAFVNPTGAIEVRALDERRRPFLRRSSGGVESLTLSPDGNSLGVLIRDSVEVWNLASHSLAGPPTTVEGMGGWLFTFWGGHILPSREVRATTVAGDLVVMGDEVGHVYVSNPLSPDEDYRAPVGDGEVLIATLSATGTRVAAVTAGGSLRAWRLDRPRATDRCRLNPEEDRDVISGDGTRIAFLNDDGGVTVCDVATQRDVMHVDSADRFSELVLSWDGRWLAAIRDDTVSVWDIGSEAEPVHVPVPPDYSRGELGVSTDGSRIAVAGGNPWTVAVLSADSRRTLFRAPLRGSADPSGSDPTFALSGDGRHLLVCGWRGTLDLLDVEAQRVVDSMALGSSISSCFFGPGDTLFATSTVGVAARIWSMPPIVELARIRIGLWLGAGLGRGGRLLALDTAQRLSEHIWQPQELIDDICARLLTNLSWSEWRQHLGDEPYRATCPALPVPDDVPRAGTVP